VSIDASAARALPGVVTVLSHENAPRLVPLDDAELAVFQSNAIAYHGQFVAVVVSTVAQICRQTWTKAVSLALKGSSLSAFLLYAERLSLQVMSVRCYRLKRHLFGPSVAPPP